jgi:hypothetical protein
MTRFIKVLLLLGLFNIASNSFAQISISYYSSSLSKIGTGYNFSDRFWTELRLYSTTMLEDITPELVFCYNFVKRDRHNVYAGVGANVNFFTGPVLPVGVQFTPLEQFNRFSLHIELQPSLDVISGDMVIQASWGLRYKFSKQ